MSKKRHVIFDRSKAGPRGEEIRIDEIARNYNDKSRRAFAAPAIIGHSSDYQPDTRIPAGAWHDELFAEGDLLYATFDEPGTIDVEVPPMFQELAAMPAFFKKAVNNKLYSNRSIGVIELDGQQHLHHTGFLGATLPECKGMPDIVFTEHPKFKVLTTDFSSAGHKVIEFTEEVVSMKNLLTIFKEIAALSPDKLKVFSEIDVTKLTEEEIKAMTDLIPLLKSILGLNETSSIMELLGALKVREADFKRLQEALAAVGAVATTPGSAVSSFSELADLVTKLQTPVDPPKTQTGMLAEFAAAITAATQPLVQELAEMRAKIKKFEEAPPADPNAPPATPPAGTELKVDTLGKSDEDCQKAADEAKQKIVDKKNWIPAYDENLMPVMKIAANIKCGEGSALDYIVNALTAVEGIAEMAEHFTKISKLIHVEEFIEKRTPAADPDKTPASHVVLRKGETVQNGDIYKKVVEFQMTNKIATYGEAASQMHKQNLL